MILAYTKLIGMGCCEGGDSGYAGKVGGLV